MQLLKAEVIQVNENLNELILKSVDIQILQMSLNWISLMIRSAILHVSFMKFLSPINVQLQWLVRSSILRRVWLQVQTRLPKMNHFLRSKIIGLKSSIHRILRMIMNICLTLIGLYSIFESGILVLYVHLKIILRISLSQICILLSSDHKSLFACS